MQVIPVLDLRAGRAVHAVRGDRARYAPVESPLARAGDALALARACRALGARRAYVADLDALTGGAPQFELLATLADPEGFGGPLLVDAAAADATRAAMLAALAPGVQVIVALETLASLDALGAIVARAGRARVVFSLDLRDGRPLARPALQGRDAVALARAAVEAGATGVVAIDLARVGAGAGIDDALVTRLRAGLEGVELLVGGGVRDVADLERLAALGVDGALVATALHAGRVTAEDIARFAE